MNAIVYQYTYKSSDIEQLPNAQAMQFRIPVYPFLHADILNGPSGKGVVDLYTPEIVTFNSTIISEIIAFGTESAATKRVPLGYLFSLNQEK